jgi:hypothetical protein
MTAVVLPAPVLITRLNHHAVADHHRDVAVPHREVAEEQTTTPIRCRFSSSRHPSRVGPVTAGETASAC